MKKFVKIFGIVVVIFILLVVAAAIIIPLVVDPNDYKDRIVALVEKETGRQMKIPGEISLSFFPWLGVKLGVVELSNAKGFKAPFFARMEELQIRAKLMPLLSKRVEADVVKVRGLTVNLERNREGRTNWDDLIKTEPQKRPEGPGEQKPAVGAEALVIGGVDVSNASVTWSDEMTGQHLSLSDLSIKTSAVTLAGPLDVKVGFAVDTGNMGLKARLDAETRVVMNMEAKTYALEDLKLGSDLKGQMLPGGALKIKGKGKVSFDLGAQRVKFSPMQLETSGMSLPPYKVSAVVEAEGTGDLAAQVFDMPGLKVDTTMVAGKDRLRANLGGKLRADLKGQKVKVSNLAVNLPELVSKESQIQLSTTQGGTLTLDLASMALVLESMKMTGKISDKALPGGSMPVAFGFGLRGDLKQQAVDIDPFQLEALDMKAAGRFSVRQKDKTPEVRGSLNIARFNLKAFLARVAKDLPKTADPKALSSAELSVAFAANPDEVKAEKIALNLDDTRLTGSVEVKNIASPDVRFDLALDRINLDRYLPPKQAPGSPKPAPAGPAAGAAAAGALPLEDLRKLSLEGNLRVSDLTVSGIKMSNFATGIQAKGGVVRMHPITAALYDGTYSGSVELDVRSAKPRIRFDEKLSKTRLDRMLKDLGVQPGGLDLTGASDLSMKGAVTSDGAFRVLEIEQMAAAGNLAGKLALGVDAPGTLVDLKEETLNADRLKIMLGDMNLMAKAKVAGFSKKPSFSADVSAPAFNLRRILEKMGKQPIETADPRAMTQVELNALVKGNAESLSVETLKVRLDDTRMEGKAEIALQPAPGYAFDMRVDEIDLDRYLPPPRKGPKAAPPKGAKPAAPTPGTRPAPLPMDQLRALNLIGKFALGKLKISNLRLQDIQVQARAKDGLITLDPMNASLYGGTSRGNVSIDARGPQPKLAVDEKLANVQSGPLLKDLQGRSFLTGLAASGIKLTAVGADRDEITRTLNGNVDFQLKDGTIEGLNILGKVCRALTAVSAGSLRKEDLISSALQMATQRAKKDEGDAANRTRFSEMGGTMVFRNGVGSNNDLILKSPLLRVEGAGTLDLPNQQINYKATAALVKSCEGQGGKGFDELANYPIPVTITGPLDNPDVKPNLTAGIIQTLGKRAAGEEKPPATQPPQQQLQDRLIPLLERPAQQPPPPTQQPPPPTQQPPQQQVKDGIGPLVAPPSREQPPAQQPAPPPKSSKEQREDAARDLIQKGLQDLFKRK